jgi:predicted glutamine amidotransferase
MENLPIKHNHNLFHHDLKIENIKLKSEEQLEKEFQRYKRYKIESTIILMESSEKICLKLLKSKMRKLDEILKISDYCYLIIFSYTNLEDSYKASQNLISFLNKNLIHISMDNYQSSDKDHFYIIRRLNNILNEVKKNEYSLVSDNSIFESNF